MAVRVPQAVRSKALVAGAHRWLDDLDSVVEALADEWSMTVGRSYQDATEAYVAEAMMSDGTPAVLKVCVPRDGDAAKNEMTVLRLAGGHGCVTLLRHDEAVGAMLLERLGRSLAELDRPIEDRHEILCAAARQLWRPAPDCGLPTGADKSVWLREHIAAAWEDLDRPCTEQAVAYALECAARRAAAHDDERAMLVHGDVHQWNVLQVPGTEQFRLVDPDGLLAEPEYDLGIIMREDPVELLQGDPRDRAYSLAARTGLDPTAIWEWGVVERVSTGLICTAIDLQPVGAQMLGAADTVARDHASW